MSQKGKGFIQRYYRNIYNLSLCIAVLLSGNFQSENVAAGEIVRTMILSEYLHYKPQKASVTFIIFQI